MDGCKCIMSVEPTSIWFIILICFEPQTYELSLGDILKQQNDNYLFRVKDIFDIVFWRVLLNQVQPIYLSLHVNFFNINTTSTHTISRWSGDHCKQFYLKYNSKLN